MFYVGLLALWNILVPKVTAADIFEPKVLPRLFNEFHQILGVGVHKLCPSTVECSPGATRLQADLITAARGAPARCSAPEFGPVRDDVKNRHRAGFVIRHHRANPRTMDTTKAGTIAIAQMPTKASRVRSARTPRV